MPRAMKAVSLLAVRPRLGEYPIPTRTQRGTRPSTTSTHRALVIAITDPGRADWSSRDRCAIHVDPSATQAAGRGDSPILSIQRHVFDDRVRQYRLSNQAETVDCQAN